MKFFLQSSFKGHHLSLRNYSEVVIVGAKRTPFGAFRGKLSSFSGPALGGKAIEAALTQSQISFSSVNEALLGSVLSGGSGQAPDRQAVLSSSLPPSLPSTLINKVCASGMKAIMLGAESIASGRNQVVVAGGFESMSNVPFYLKRGEIPYGGLRIYDGLLVDGLTDVSNGIHMGVIGENTASKFSISRKDQDDYALLSYKRAGDAYSASFFSQEIFSLEIPIGKGDSSSYLESDEEVTKFKVDKFVNLTPVFKKENGTITAGNASTLSDGAAMTILMSSKSASALGITPLARIINYADGATDPMDFPIAPTISTNKLLKMTNMRATDVDLWEINEAFSVVVLANIQLLGLDISKVNIHGGAVSLGHPLGASGARILNHLVYALKSGQRGVASICNGGGGASSIMIEKC